MTYRVQSPSMRNAVITTNYGVFRFNAEGIASGVPYGLAQELTQLSGFVVIDDEGNVIELPETDPDAENPSNTVTLEGGEIWTTIPGGYTIQDSNTVYTLIGSAFENNPPDVSLQGGTLVFGTGIDTENVHAIGVDSGTTLQIGNNTYMWQDADSDVTNGFELVEQLPETVTSNTLPGGGYYSKIDNGYIVGDDDMTYTISGDFFDSDTISIQHGSLVFSAGVDTASIHVIGVEPDATLQIGDTIYKWFDTNNNLEDGYELTPYVEPQPTLPAGWSTIEGGYVIESGDNMYTLMGSMDSSDVTIDGTTFTFSDGVDASSIHITGVNENDTVYVGSDTYIWKDTDNNTENGYELVPYVAPPEIHTLPGGATWSTVEAGVIISDTFASYTLVGAQAVDSDTVALNSGVLSFGNNIDTDAVHVLGVESGTTVAVGEYVFQWVEADLNDEDGLELIHYVAPVPEPEVHSLPSGATYDTIEGGYVVSDTGTTYTLTGGAFNEGIEGVVDIQSGTFVFDSSVTTSDVHIQGIAADTTLMVGEDTYIFKELNNNPDDGMEIEPYVPPVTVFTLPSGATYETIEGGYVVSDTSTTYTLTGMAFANGLEDVVDVQSGTFVFGTSVDTLEVHVAGVNEDDTVYVGDNAFIWKDTDENAENGLEIAEIPEPVVTLPAGWTAVEGGFAYDDGITVVTITGVDLDDNNHLPVDIGEGGMVIFDEGISPSDVHAIGVYTGDILKIGDTTYQWINVDSNPLNGLEPAAITVQPTLPAGWSTVEGGLTYTSETTAITISGIGLNEDNSLPVTVVADTIYFDPTVEADNIHVSGVNANDTLMLGQDIYTFQELDNNPENGLEIMLYVPPVETHTLPGGGTWSTVEGGYIVEDDIASYTLMGGALDEDNTAVQNGTLVFGTSIDTSALHVFGVTSDTTIQIGTDTYTWKDLDDNPDNGLELELVVPQSGGVLPSGYTWDTVEGGYVIYTDELTYTLSGSAFDNGIEGLVDIQNDHFQFSTSADITNVHVRGVYSNDTLYVGEEPYIWGNVDNNPENGLEIMSIPEPQPTIPAGWETVEGGVVYTAGSNDVTITGITLSVDTPFPVDVENNTFIFSEGVDTGSIHAIGVNEATTLQVGTNTYQWANTDNDPNNGYEIAELPPPIVFPEGWGTIDGGLTYESDTTAITITGATAEPDGSIPVVITGDTLIFNEGVDTTGIHAIGVSENDTLQVGNQIFRWKDLDNNLENGYEIAVPGPWNTIEGGFTYHNGSVAYTLYGSEFGNGDTPQHVDVINNMLHFDSEVDTTNVHVRGVESDATIQIGTDLYTWKELDGNTLNGFELEWVPPTMPLPEGWGTVEGGVTYTSDTTAVTITGIGVEDDNNLPVTYSDGKFIFSEGVDTDAIHAIGVSASDTVQVDSNVYIWTDRDNNPENGLEITVIPTIAPEPTIEPEPTVVSAWSTIDGGYVYASDTVRYTLTGSAFDGGYNDVIIDNTGNMSFQSGIDVNNVHVSGVTTDATVKVGTDTYVWKDTDGNADNGLELVIVESTDTTIIPTVEPEPTIPADDTVNGFSYDFDGVNFTLTGGLKEGISVDDLNENARIEPDGLEFGDGIISTLGGVHIQGLQSGTTVKVAGENYTLMDADDNLENGYELVGGEADAYGWKRTNRSAGIYEPQIWRHYPENSTEADILVIGCTARPLYENNTLTLLGTDIKVTANESAPAFNVAGDIYGKLTPSVGYDSNVGIVNGNGTTSYIVVGGNLYVPGAIITGIGESKFEFLISGGMLTVIKGELDVENVVVTGTSITSILYNNKKFYTNIKTGKLVRNAWQRK